MRPQVPLPWERLLWSGRPVRLLPPTSRERYLLTDFRVARVRGARVDDIVLHEIGDVERRQSRIDRVLGTSTIVVHPVRRGVEPVVLTGVRRGAQLAALLDLLSGEPQLSLDTRDVDSALSWDPQTPPSGGGVDAIVALLVMVAAVFGVVIGVHGNTRPRTYGGDDDIAPRGVKRSRAEIVRLMEVQVMPWARQALGRVAGGPEHVTCETCHGAEAAARNWNMPAVAALPQPDVKDRGWETYGAEMDAQMRNAIYGYLADSEKQTKAGYMREVVMPGMAALLRRPAYDFTQSYEYNRSRQALGCYHCHKVK